MHLTAVEAVNKVVASAVQVSLEAPVLDANVRLAKVVVHELVADLTAGEALPARSGSRSHRPFH